MPTKPSPTHFLCLQLSSAQLSRSLAAFRADATSLDSFAIPGDAVRPPGTLHLTLGVMSLKQDDGLSQAVDVLKSLKPRDILGELRCPYSSSTAISSSTSTSTSTTASQAIATNNDGLLISFRGLHAMTHPSRTSVLYAPPTDAEGILYRFCERLRKPFRESGFIEEERPLLLHATIINTIYVKSMGGGRRRERLMLDAEDLLRKYDDYEWVEGMPVTKVALCKMGAKKVEGSDDEVYEVVEEIEI
ncbi:hypothetical protein QQS21_008327 [Conoideocrella luteorostrata]|uniref:A-kinase anchor protein 7-like phosphoesterase domain-containing protein n=1 Tax=Conoideocrella luteorostrata TaxID=1105319 RepID=A0AAJ0FWM3_9HYPO|nr:hypothetical protein QQS21_008327 [Conoideocrella luteorostrata]